MTLSRALHRVHGARVESDEVAFGIDDERTLPASFRLTRRFDDATAAFPGDGERMFETMCKADVQTRRRERLAVDKPAVSLKKKGKTT